MKLGELCILGEGVWLLLLLWLLHRTRFRAFSEAEPDRQVVKLFGGEAFPAPPLWCILSGACELTCMFRPLVLRTCLRIQARRLVRQLCSDKTSLDQGLHSTMSRAEIATARPTCSNISGVYLGGNEGGGGGVARPLSWQADGIAFMVFPVL